MVDEIPFDFSRRMMSVAVEGPDGERQLLTKGAPEAVFAKCTHFESEGEIFPMEPILAGDLVQQVNELSEDGFRVLAVATKKLGQQTTFSKADECDLVLTGYLAFLDPPKDTAAKAIEALRQHGVTVKVLTGDNDLVTRKVCSEVGIHAEKILLGSQVENMTDAQLAEAVETTDVFARLSPAHKKRVVQALQKKGPRRRLHGRRHQRRAGAARRRRGHFRGQRGGHRQGIRRHDSAGKKPDGAGGRRARRPQSVCEHLEIHPHGREFQFRQHVQRASARARWFPFLPMQPLQILTNNLLYDFSQVPIPTDNVGAQYIAKPRPWNMGEIAKFIIFIGPISSIFDYTTFFVMWFFFKCNQRGADAGIDRAFWRQRRRQTTLTPPRSSTPAGLSNPS